MNAEELPFKDCSRVLDNKESKELVLYSYQYVVAAPLGLTLAFSFADELVIAVTELLLTVGAVASAGPLVVKFKIS